MIQRKVARVNKRPEGSISVLKDLWQFHISICSYSAFLVVSMMRPLGSLSPILRLPDKSPQQRQDCNYFA